MTEPPQGLTLRQALRLVAPGPWDSYQRDGSDDSLGEVLAFFGPVMDRGALVATGRRADRPDQETPIEPGAWMSGAVTPVLWCDELLSQGLRVFNVALYQPVALPDFTRRLVRAGTLAEAFGLFVSGNPVAAAAVARVDGVTVVGPSRRYTFACGDILAGLFPSPAGAWPMRLDSFDLAAAWLEPEPGNGTGPTSFDALKRDLAPSAALATVERSAAIVRDVVRRFLHPLRNGAVQALGHHVASGQLGPIAPAVWSTPGMGFDRKGRIGGIEGDCFAPVWNAVHFGIEDAPAGKTRDRTKRKDAISWDYALDQMMFYMHGSGRFTSKRQFALQVIDILEGKKQPTEEQVYDFFATFYPQFWSLLRR